MLREEMGSVTIGCTTLRKIVENRFTSVISYVDTRVLLQQHVDKLDINLWCVAAVHQCGHSIFIGCVHINIVFF